MKTEKKAENSEVFYSVSSLFLRLRHSDRFAENKDRDTRRMSWNLISGF